MGIEKAKQVLKHQFGFDSFRLHQEVAIEAVLQRQRLRRSDADRRRQVAVLSNTRHLYWTA